MVMLKFDEQKQLEKVKGVLELRGTVEKIVDRIVDEGYVNICWLGIGGTYASALQVEIHMKEKSKIPFFVENAAEYLTTGNKKIGEGTVVIISSVTGSTSEMVLGVEKMQEAGAKVIGFIDEKTAKLAQMVDDEIAYPGYEQIKFFMVADRLMYRNGEFEDYDVYYKQLDKYLAQGLIDTAKNADEFAKQFVENHHNDQFHYFVGSGKQWGATYSYAMCYWEEMHWIRTKSIHAAEFFHGMLEIVERDTNITIFVGEDSQRSLSERVAQFIPRICSRYTVIDAKDYSIEGIDQKYRGDISHLILHEVTQRIDAHMEKANCHPMEIRRYYRQLEY
jgi:fructoselysine-6-phosphate deglycase